MKNKNVALTIIALTLLLCNPTIAYCRGAIETLFNHRIELEKRDDGLIRAMRHQNLKEWREKENEIFEAFLELFKGNRFDGYKYISDTLLITLLVEMLGELPSQMDNAIESRLVVLPYPYLNIYRVRIIDKLRQIDYVNRFSYLAAIINPPADMKKQLLASDALNKREYRPSEKRQRVRQMSGLRARLGDKKNEKEIIDVVNKLLEISIGVRARFGDIENELRFVDSINGVFNLSRVRLLEDAIDELFLCGTGECLKTAVSFFARFQPRLDSMGRVSEHQYYMLGPQHGPQRGHLKSPRELIIRGFRQYQPELPMLHAEYDSLMFRFGSFGGHRSRQTRLDEEAIIVEYMERFLDWGNKTYDANFKLENKLLFIGQPDNEIYVIRRHELRERLFNEKKWTLIEETNEFRIYYSKDIDGKEQYFLDSEI